MGRPEGRRLLEDLGVDGNRSNGSSAMLIILPDEDDSQFLYRISLHFYNSVASVPAKAVNGVLNFVSFLNKRIKIGTQFHMTNKIYPNGVLYV